MKAVVQSGYGPAAEVLSLQEVAPPRLRTDEVLVRVRAASVHADVWHVVTGQPYVLRLMGAGVLAPKAKVPGTDLAGTVEAVGTQVSRFKVGDAVFGETLRGMQWKNGGAFAEYAAAPESALALIPDGVGFEEAASVPTAGYIAWTNLDGASALGPGAHVLVNGAAGGVGAMALQIAKARGAVVTAVDRGDKLDFVKRLGADHLVDYQTDDCTQATGAYDLVFDVASTLSLDQAKRMLKPGGRFVVIGHDHYGSVGRRVLGSLPQMMTLMARAMFDPQLPKPTAAVPKQVVMEGLKQLLAQRQLTPVVGRAFPLEAAVQALASLQEGSVLGRVVLTP